MANHVTISTFSSLPDDVPLDMSAAEAVARMIDSWRVKLDNVLPDCPDVIVLPEICDIPPSWRQDKMMEYLTVRAGRAQDFFSGVADAHSCYIAYASARQVPDGTWRNSVTLLDRAGGVAGIYDKNHVVINEYEDCGFQYGTDAGLIECDFGRVACVICFDLNFDELRLRVAAARPDLILFSSMYHGGLMQAYWAYSCRAHFAAALHIKRPSAIILPTGDILATTTNYFDYVTATVNLDCELFHLDINRPKMEAAKTKYGHKLRLHDPGLLGAVLLSSETDEFSIEDIAKEFELEPLEEYLGRSLAHRHEHVRVGTDQNEDINT